jgi:hypothetical protein
MNLQRTGCGTYMGDIKCIQTFHEKALEKACIWKTTPELEW